MRKSIYVIKNKINNKVYVGQAIDPQHRFISHLSRAKTNADHSPIHDAIAALGKKIFIMKFQKKILKIIMKEKNIGQKNYSVKFHMDII